MYKLSLLVALTLCSCSRYWSALAVFVPPTKPDYADLEKQDASTLSQDPAFIKACEEHAGYYKDPARNPSLKKTLVLAGVNNGYKDFFHNFKCYMDRLGVKFFPVSLDVGIYSYLTNNKVRSVVIDLFLCFLTLIYLSLNILSIFRL